MMNKTNKCRLNFLDQTFCLNHDTPLNFMTNFLKSYSYYEWNIYFMYLNEIIIRKIVSF